MAWLHPSSTVGPLGLGQSAYSVLLATGTGYGHIADPSREGRGDTGWGFCSGRDSLGSAGMAKETISLLLDSRVWGWKGWSCDNHFATIRWECGAAGDHNMGPEDEAETREGMCLDGEKPGAGDVIWVMRSAFPKAVALNEGVSVAIPPPQPPGDIWQCLEAFLVLATWSLLLTSRGRGQGYC